MLTIGHWSKRNSPEISTNIAVKSSSGNSIEVFVRFIFILVSLAKNSHGYSGCIASSLFQDSVSNPGGFGSVSLENSHC